MPYFWRVVVRRENNYLIWRKHVKSRRRKYNKEEVIGRSSRSEILHFNDSLVKRPENTFNKWTLNWKGWNKWAANQCLTIFHDYVYLTRCISEGISIQIGPLKRLHFITLKLQIYFSFFRMWYALLTKKHYLFVEVQCYNLTPREIKYNYANYQDLGVI